MQQKSEYLRIVNKLLRHRKFLSVVIVGANDGKINDPLYETLIQNSQNTRVLCIEPNPFLIPYLKKNYSTHPNFHFLNCAVGQGHNLTLYAIKPQYFEAFQPNYARTRKWPSYRAATGITSSNRKHLSDAIIRENLNPEEVIEKLEVPCSTLSVLLARIGFTQNIDILQIDTEGYDDNVIYNSTIEITKPQIIFFEHAHISEERMVKLIEYLYKLKYRVNKLGADTIAVRKRPRFTDLMLRITS